MTTTTTTTRTATRRTGRDGQRRGCRHPRHGYVGTVFLDKDLGLGWTWRSMNWHIGGVGSILYHDSTRTANTPEHALFTVTAGGGAGPPDGHNKLMPTPPRLHPVHAVTRVVHDSRARPPMCRLGGACQARRGTAQRSAAQLQPDWAFMLWPLVLPCSFHERGLDIGGYKQGLVDHLMKPLFYLAF